MVNGEAFPSFPPLKLVNASGGGSLNFHQLYIFYAVATHRSFSRAAEFLNITQPAVSIKCRNWSVFWAPLCSTVALGACG